MEKRNKPPALLGPTLRLPQHARFRMLLGLFLFLGTGIPAMVRHGREGFSLATWALAAPAVLGTVIYTKARFEMENPRK